MGNRYDEKIHEGKKFYENPLLSIFIPIVIAIIALFPENFLPYRIQICISIVFLSALFLLIHYAYKDFIDYVRNRSLFYNLVHTMFKYVYIKKESYIVSLHEDVNKEFEVKRCLVVQNLSDNIINGFFIPWFYDIYDIKKEEDYKPKIRSIQITYYDKICQHTVSYDIKNPEHAPLIEDFVQPDGVMTVKDNPYPEARGWIKVPIRLEPKKTININIIMNQKFIYQKMYEKVGEYAGAFVTSPTGELHIEVIAPDTKNLTPVYDIGESIKIENKILNLTDYKEIASVEQPKYDTRRVVWNIKYPKVNHYYMLRFKLIPPHISESSNRTKLSRR